MDIENDGDIGRFHPILIISPTICRRNWSTRMPSRENLLLIRWNFMLMSRGVSMDIDYHERLQ
jgi:hypothetical protein